MFTVFVMLYKLSWRYRVRPQEHWQHASGTSHNVVLMSDSQWYCQQCPRTSHSELPATAVEKLTGVLIIALAVVLFYVGYKITGFLLGIVEAVL